MVTGFGTTTAGLPLVQKARLLVAVNGGAVEVEAKRRKTRGPLVAVEVIEPRMSRDERENLAGSPSSLSLDLPPHIVEFLQRQCSAVLDGGEMEINLHSAGDASLFQLKKLLDEFAVERKKRERLEAEPEPHKDEDVAASGALIKDEEEDEFVHICGEASPVVLDKMLPKTGSGSPSSSSSSSSSSSGSSCGGDSSDSDSDSGESTGSSPLLAIGVSLGLTCLVDTYKTRSHLSSWLRQFAELSNSEQRIQVRGRRQQQICFFPFTTPPPLRDRVPSVVDVAAHAAPAST